MDPNQLTAVLLNCNTPDPNVRQLAEKWLQDAEQQNFALYLQILCMELSNNEKPPESRSLAGLQLKNALVAQDENTKMQKVQKWLSLDQGLKGQIKAASLATLASPQREARARAAQVVAAIANIELPRNLWPDLIQHLLNNMNQENDHIKQTTLEALGYICEEIEPEVLQTQANQILTAVCKGIKDPNNEIKLAGCRAMLNALEFVRSNFEKEVERNYIMQVLCDAASCPDPKVRTASMECIVNVASLYYDKLAVYMQKIFNITLESIKNLKEDTEEVALQAIEFWSTVADEEIYLSEEAAEAAEMKQQPARVSSNFIMGALKFLVPVLTETLTRQEDEPDEDTWNPAMAAGTCLALVAQTVRDEVVPHVMPFVQQHINNPDWKFREAATLAFGAILEGPENYLPQLITQAIPILLAHMKDQVVYVKDTTAWTLGRVCQLHPQTVGGYLPQLIQVLAESFADSPRVAANACWAIHNLALSYEEDSDKQTSALSPYFRGLLTGLVQTTDREDVEENNLRAAAYEVINVLIQSGAQDTVSCTLEAVPLFISRLEKTFAMQILTSDDREIQSELQSLLCGVLGAITTKLGDAIKPWADQMMTLFLQVFNARSASVHEEALMAVGAVANAVEGDFEKYMGHFRPFLMVGLKNYEEHQVCAVAVGVVGDIARAINNKISPYCDEIVSLLLQDLQNPLLHRNVKPPILSCFGDIAMAIGQDFIKYLGIVMNMLQQASATTVDPNDYDLVDYLNQLREGIFEAYTGIIQGLRGDNAADPHLLGHVQHIVNFVNFVCADTNRSEAVTRGAVGVLGDLAHALGPKAKPFLTQPFIKTILDECLKGDGATRDVAQWARDTISKL